MKIKQEYKVIKSFRKTMSLQIKNWEIIVKAPFLITKKTIESFLNKHTKWIEKKLERRHQSVIDPDKIWEYKRQAKQYITTRVAEIAKIHNITYNDLRITSAKTRWGSCSSKRNINFSFRLILTPKEVIDYVIIHELSHLKEMNHSKSFWNEVKKIMPDYKKYEKWLKKNWDLYTY